MENQVLWKEEYNIGVDIIDQEHQKLFQTINELFALRREKGRIAGLTRKGFSF